MGAPDGREGVFGGKTSHQFAKAFPTSVKCSLVQNLGRFKILIGEPLYIQGENSFFEGQGENSCSYLG
jgi:hypothetical protein